MVISIAKEKIALAPNNPSAWNYLRGILDHSRVPYSTQASFARQYIVDTVEPEGNDILDLENPPPSEGAELPCAAAIEFMADVHEATGKEGISEAVEVRKPDMSNGVAMFSDAIGIFASHGAHSQTPTTPSGKGTPSSAVRDPIMFIHHVSGTGNIVFVMQSRPLVKRNSVPRRSACARREKILYYYPGTNDDVLLHSGVFFFGNSNVCCDNHWWSRAQSYIQLHRLD